MWSSNQKRWLLPPNWPQRSRSNADRYSGDNLPNLGNSRPVEVLQPPHLARQQPSYFFFQLK
jgi:hypothetical protein